jgi:hypothetical protein
MLVLSVVPSMVPSIELLHRFYIWEELEILLLRLIINKVLRYFEVM